jgi:amidohydrolase
MTELSQLKHRVIAAVSEQRETLIETANAIHANPELAFKEYKAVERLTGILQDRGFSVERGVAGLETAFVASFQGRAADPKVAFLAEYDALAGVGHACGHNLIAAAALGAGLAVQKVISELPGTILVIGTPAEEQGGGKIIMVEAGLFDQVDAAIMIHPSAESLIARLSLTDYPVCIEFFGKTAHAAAAPDQGINALEALLLTFNSINALRQYLRDDARIHGIITHGGEASNVIPDYARAEFSVRSLDTPYAAELVEKVRACAEGAAKTIGARLEFGLCGPRYDARIPNPKLVELFRENMQSLGVEIKLATGNERMGSSDMGNVSQVVPAIHPYLSIGPEDLIGHTPEFCAAAASATGHETMINGAKAMAMTAVDVLANPEVMEAVRRTFHESKP